MSTEIKRLIAPVIAMLKHDVARPDAITALDKAYALEQLEEVMEILNAKAISVVESSIDHPEETRILRDLIQESLQKRD